MNKQCPDGAICHHKCDDSCWRVHTCLPLAGTGWKDWSDKIKKENQPVVRFENLLIDP